jgi:hypothetical protein
MSGIAIYKQRFKACSNIGVKECMEMKRIGPFSRLFILINRLFGAMCVVVGIALVFIALGQAITRGVASTNFWQTLGIGICVVVAGVIYLRAPLFRDTGAKLERRDPPEELNRLERTMKQEVDREP